MAHRSFLAVAFVGLGLFSCGAGEVADPGAPAIDQHPAGNPNQPVSSIQHPAPNPNQPVSNQQPGGSPGQPPGGGDVVAICTEYCNVLLDCTGLRGQPDGELGVVICLASCVADLSGAPECADLVLDHQSCVAGIGQVCTVLQDQTDVNTPGCEAEDEALGACVGGEIDDCTLEAGCLCGGDLCDACLCSSTDATLCDSFCVAT